MKQATIFRRHKWSGGHLEWTTKTAPDLANHSAVKTTRGEGSSVTRLLEEKNSVMKEILNQLQVTSDAQWGDRLKNCRERLKSKLLTAVVKLNVTN